MAYPSTTPDPNSRPRRVVLGTVAAGLLTRGVLGGCAVASAQPAPAPRQEPPGPPPAGQVPPERLGSDIPSSEGDRGRRPGSGAPSGGEIRPPAGVDRGIQAPAPSPNPGTTPVIPPPGTPGGDPRVDPR